MPYSTRERLQTYVSSPKQKGLTEEQASNTISAAVADCDDKMEIYIEVQDNIVTVARFIGHGCAVSTGSTEAILQVIEGRPVEEVNDIINVYEKFINGDIDNIMEELQVFEIVQTHVSRKKCALASIDAIKEGVNRDE